MCWIDPLLNRLAYTINPQTQRSFAIFILKGPNYLHNMIILIIEWSVFQCIFNEQEIFHSNINYGIHS